MKTLILAAVRCSLIFTAVTASLFSVQPAQAYTVTLQQVGSNVVATGSGPINLTGLTFLLSGHCQSASQINASFGDNTDGANGLCERRPVHWIHRTDEFRERGLFFANTGSGDFVGISGLLGLGFFSCHRAMSPVLLYRIA